MRVRDEDEDGAAATEFALIAPLLILLFFGIVWFGLLIYRAQVLESATREGARQASIGGDVTDVRDAIISAAVGIPDATNTITVESSSQYCDARGDIATINVTATGAALNFTVPFYGTVAPNLESTATFECERTR